MHDANSALLVGDILALVVAAAAVAAAAEGVTPVGSDTLQVVTSKCWGAPPQTPSFGLGTNNKGYLASVDLTYVHTSAVASGANCTPQPDRPGIATGEGAHLSMSTVFHHAYTLGTTANR